MVPVDRFLYVNMLHASILGNIHCPLSCRNSMYVLCFFLFAQVNAIQGKQGGIGALSGERRPEGSHQLLPLHDRRKRTRDQMKEQKTHVWHKKLYKWRRTKRPTQKKGWPFILGCTLKTAKLHQTLHFYGAIFQECLFHREPTSGTECFNTLHWIMKCVLCGVHMGLGVCCDMIR